MLGSGMSAVATGARVMRKEGPKSERRREMRRVVVEREVSSSMSRSRPSSLYFWTMALRGV